MAKLIGAWKLVFTSDNFDAYMSEVGVSFMNRKLMLSVKPDVHFEESGGEWKMTAKSTVKTTVTKFKLDEEFSETRADGTKIQTIIKQEGDNKLIQVQKGIAKGGQDSTITREVVSDNEMVVTCVANAITATRKYSRIKYRRDKMSKLLGVWRLVYTSDNFEAYMIEVGVNFVNRKLMMTVKPDLFVEENRGEWTITAKSTIRTVVTKFRLGEEFTETRADGVTMQSIITKEGENKLIQVQKGIATGGGDSVITREVVNNDTELLVTCVANSVTGIRKYNRLAEGPGGVSTVQSKAQKRGGEQDSDASVGQSNAGKD
ncbi:unnamed protein product [Cyprideis torosa]|uniref:Lipocalin/cytosolic fatty-acid binding domain-containing protein n=1 Tax=Cyprideis torosa TaxID=163714 RepID=A0A7R8ZUC8_9CRUS|nr:unnamed protein product [Cyprideis torosa]CAG0900291.1 unnamed protein product [Cyprideis torosa]